MNVLIPVHFAVAEQAVSEGRLVHSRPDVLIGRSFQCGYFRLVGFCAPVLLTTPILPSFPPTCSSSMLCASDYFYS